MKKILLILLAVLLFSSCGDDPVSPEIEYQDVYFECSQDIINRINIERSVNGLDSVEFIERFLFSGASFSLDDLSKRRELKKTENGKWIHYKIENIYSRGNSEKNRTSCVGLNYYLYFENYYTDPRKNIKIFPIYIYQIKKDFNYKDDEYYDDYKFEFIIFETTN